MRKIIRPALYALLLVCALSAHTFAATLATMPAEDEIVRVVGLLGIMNGDENGNLNLDNKVTRAEFTKMALCASSMKNEVSAGSNVSPFPDVRASHWAVGYVTKAVSAGIIRGYQDGNFRPGNEVTLEEAVTILLRLMGYSDLDAGEYPTTQLAKYRELNMDCAIAASRGQALTRRECMYLVYNALCSKGRGGQIYCTTLGYAADNNDRIDYLSLVNAKTEGPYVVQDGSWTSRIPFDASSANVYRGNARITLADVQTGDVYYYSDTLKEIRTYRETVTGVVGAINPSRESPSSVMIGNKSYALSTADCKKQFSAMGEYDTDSFVTLLLGSDSGAVLAIDGDVEEFKADPDNDYDSTLIATLKGPYVVTSPDTWQSKLPFDISDATIYNGVSNVDLSYVEVNDVFYYSETFKTVWLCRETATGIVNAISPSQESPASVTLGSKTYTLDTPEVKKQFSTSGSYVKTDFVTLLLGRDGKAVLAVDGDALDYALNNDDDVTYSQIVKSTMKGPVVVRDAASWQYEIPFDLSDATFYKKNSEAKASDVEKYDVLYYSQPLRSVWIYSDKATGTFESVSPNRITPESITLSGKTYPLEESAAAHSVSNLGSYVTGDLVTLLLGKNGGAVEVISGSDFAADVYGFITGFSQKTYERANGTTYTADCITILGIDAQTYAYEYAADYFTKGDFVSVSFTGGKASIRKVKSNVTSAETTTLNSLIAENRFADDALLLDVQIRTDSDSIENSTVTYGKLYPSRLEGAKLQSGDVYYYETENGRVTKLILNDFTGDLATYGILAAKRTGGVLGYYLLQGGKETALSLNPGYPVPTVGPAKFTERGGLYRAAALDCVTVDKGGLAPSLCTANGKTYRFASDVTYYLLDSGKYTVTTYADVSGGSYTFRAYFDDTEARGGRVRIVVAEAN